MASVWAHWNVIKQGHSQQEDRLACNYCKKEYMRKVILCEKHLMKCTGPVPTAIRQYYREKYQYYPNDIVPDCSNEYTPPPTHNNAHDNGMIHTHNPVQQHSYPNHIQQVTPSELNSMIHLAVLDGHGHGQLQPSSSTHHQYTTQPLMQPTGHFQAISSQPAANTLKKRAVQQQQLQQQQMIHHQQQHLSRPPGQSPPKQHQQKTPLTNVVQIRSRLEKAVEKLKEKDDEIAKLKRTIKDQQDSVRQKQVYAASKEVENERLRAEIDKVRMDNARLNGKIDEAERWKAMVTNLLSLAETMVSNASNSRGALNGTQSTNPLNPVNHGPQHFS